MRPRVAEFLRLLDEIGERLEREDAEKAASQQAAPELTTTSVPQTEDAH